MDAEARFGIGSQPFSTELFLSHLTKYGLSSCAGIYPFIGRWIEKPYAMRIYITYFKKILSVCSEGSVTNRNVASVDPWGAAPSLPRSAGLLDRHEALRLPRYPIMRCATIRQNLHLVSAPFRPLSLLIFFFKFDSALNFFYSFL